MDNKDIRGGLQTVTDLIERDAIIPAIRVLGMKVYVSGINKYYNLIGGLTNGNWVEDAGGGGGGLAPQDHLKVADAGLISSKTIVLPSTPSNSIVHMSLNGMGPLVPGIGEDFTISGDTITLDGTLGFDLGSKFYIIYWI